jgi:hypothetical protein
MRHPEAERLAIRTRKKTPGEGAHGASRSGLRDAVSRGDHIALAIAVPVLLIAVNVWLWASVLPRRRRELAQHPERRPHGWNLVLRYAPFMALGVFCSIALGGHWLLLLPVMLLAFAWDIRKRWRPPAAR